MKFALLFPGQGAQKVGMGQDFAALSSAARALFDQADAILGIPLTQLCFEGPLESLTATDVAQPAIYTCSLAVLAALEERRGEPLEPAMAAGLSLGEYTALAATGAFSFADGLRLVRIRGAAMQAASEALASGMVSIMGLDLELLQALCTKIATQTKGICQVANLNSPGQVVVSGELHALAALEEAAKSAGARRITRLQVAGAFHSEVMRPAAKQLEEALEQVDFHKTSCPVWQNSTAQPATEPAVLKANLIDQLCTPVLWQQSFAAMADALPEGQFLEPAPGRVLGALARKIVPDSKVVSLRDTAALDALLSIPS